MFHSLQQLSKPTPRRPLRYRPHLDVLEDRLAPATVVSPTQLTYQDADGDNVSVTFSKPILTSDAAANVFLAFSTGNVNGSNATPQQLRRIDLRGSGAAAATGTKITVEAVANGGDGVAHVGFIEATGKDLGKVIVDGDLGRIHAGDVDLTTPGVKAVFAGSMGVQGLSTQAPGSDLHSDIEGPVVKIIVAGDIQAAGIELLGNVDEIRVGGSIIGGAAADSGSLFVAGKLGLLTIVEDLVGGGGNFTGRIEADGGIGDVSIRSVIGGNGFQSGVILSLGKIKNVVLEANLSGGAGNQSGRIASARSLASLTVLDSIFGGSGEFSGRVDCLGGSIGDIHISRFFFSGPGLGSGALTASGNLGSIFVGLVIAGGAARRVVISAGGIDTDGPARIGNITLGGANFADILCGYDTTAVSGNVRSNADARIGAVNVGVDWNASNLIAGVDVGPDGLFGTADDGTTVAGSDAFISKIGAVTIGGSAEGTNGGTDHFGIVAEQVKALSVDGQGVALNLGPLNDLNVSLGSKGDFVLKELKA